MPIVQVEIVLKPNETISDRLAQQLADKLGEQFESPKGGTWVKVYGIVEKHYAENGGKEEGVFPVFVSVIKAKLPSYDELQIEVEKITGVVAQICERLSTLVHVIYEPEGSGRVSFGGKLTP